MRNERDPNSYPSGTFFVASNASDKQWIAATAIALSAPPNGDRGKNAANGIQRISEERDRFDGPALELTGKSHLRHAVKD